MYWENTLDPGVHTNGNLEEESSA